MLVSDRLGRATGQSYTTGYLEGLQSLLFKPESEGPILILQNFGAIAAPTLSLLSN